MPASLETLDLFDNQLDQAVNHLTGLASLLVRLDIGANNLSSEVVKSLGPRLSLSNVVLIVGLACAGIQNFGKIYAIGVEKFL